MSERTARQVFWDDVAADLALDRDSDPNNVVVDDGPTAAEEEPDPPEWKRAPYKPPVWAAEHGAVEYEFGPEGVRCPCRCGWAGPWREHELGAWHDTLTHLRGGAA